jgi:hypothetical protein
VAERKINRRAEGEKDTQLSLSKRAEGGHLAEEEGKSRAEKGALAGLNMQRRAGSYNKHTSARKGAIPKAVQQQEGGPILAVPHQQKRD